MRDITVLIIQEPILIHLRFFIGMTLVINIIQVSGVQFYNTSSVYCIVYSLPQVKSPSISINPPPIFYLCHPPSPPVITKLLSVSEFSFFLLPLPFSPSSTSLLPSDSCQPVHNLWVCFYFASWFCSLDSTYKWNHMVLLFLRLAYFTFEESSHEKPMMSFYKNNNFCFRSFSDITNPSLSSHSAEAGLWWQI